jgi:hypothetical protein
MDPSKILEFIKLNGSKSFAFGAGCAAFLALAYSGLIGTVEPLVIQFVALVFCVTAALAVVALCTGIADLFALRHRFDRWMLARAERADLKRYLPFMSAQEREIIGYLLAKNERVFTADSDAGHAATLLGKRYVRIAVRGRQEVMQHSVPMEVPEHLWKVFQKNKTMFPVINPDDYSAPPWRVHWMAR